MRIIPAMENPRAMIDGHTESVCAGPVNANQKRPIATGVSQTAPWIFGAVRAVMGGRQDQG